MERSLPILRSRYFIADSVDFVHIRVTENRIPQKSPGDRPNFRNSPPTGLLEVFLHEMVKISPLQGSYFEVIPTLDEIAIVGAVVNVGA